MDASPKKSLRWWQLALLAPIIVLVVPVVVVAFVLYVASSAFLYLSIWLLWCSRGKDVLFVYSDSPIWQEYLEAQVLPKIAQRAVVLNWSQRKHWKPSLARFAFAHFGGSREFNPLGIVFRPGRRAQLFRFWQPFRDFKHGRDESLRKMESQFFDALDKTA